MCVCLCERERERVPEDAFRELPRRGRERGREEEAGVLLEQVPPSREVLPTVFKSVCVSICAYLP